MKTNKKALRWVVVAVATSLFITQIVACLYGVPSAARGQAYFRGLYTAASMVRDGHARALYDNRADATSARAVPNQLDAPWSFDHAAYEALIFVPLSLLNYRAAYWTFFVVNLLLLTVALRMLLPYFEKLPSVWRWFPAALFFCFFPVALALIQGQDSILLLTLLVASAVSFYRRQELRSGVFLGLTLFNFPLAIPIALLFLFWRRWRIVIGFAIASAGTAAISLWLTGLAQFLAPVRAAFSSAASISPVAAHLASGTYNGQLPNLHCLIEAVSGTHLSANSVLIVTALCSIAMILWAATRPPNYALAILVTLLASPQGAIQDAVLLILPLGLVLDARITPISKTHWWSRTIAGTLFVGPTLLFLAGWSYCVLSLLMLALLVTLRSTSTGYLDD